MIHTIALSVSFPVFGSNYYDQQPVSHKAQSLVFNEDFEDLLMPAATNHFSNEVVGINDQFRFLSDILATHDFLFRLVRNFAVYLNALVKDPLFYARSRIIREHFGQSLI